MKYNNGSIDSNFTNSSSIGQMQHMNSQQQKLNIQDEDEEMNN